MFPTVVAYTPVKAKALIAAVTSSILARLVDTLLAVPPTLRVIPESATAAADAPSNPYKYFFKVVANPKSYFTVN